MTTGMFCRTSRSLGALVLLVTCLAGEVVAQDRASRPVNLGNQVQLLVDDALIETAHGAGRRLGRVIKVNDGRPIFRDGWFYGTVLHDEQRFKLWYRKPGTAGFGYAESRDGKSFEKLGDVTGIRFAGDYTLAVEIDPTASDRQQRYIASFDAPGMAAGLAYSADGRSWRPANQGKPVTGRAADSYNQILWDPLAQTYRLFTRTDFGSAGGAGEVRGTRSMTNASLHAAPTDWSLVREWKFDREGAGEPQRRQSYAASCWIWRGVYFALLSVYEYPGDVSEGRKTDHVTRHKRDVMNFYIASSRDAVEWDFHWVYAGEPLVPRGPNGAFDKDLILPSSTVVTVEDSHWLYYAGANERHGTPEVPFERDHAIGLAKLPRDRLAGWAGGDVPAEILTRPFEWAGGELRMNLEAPEGECRVALVTEAGDTIDGLSAVVRNVDELEWKPMWTDTTSLASLAGRVVRLKVTLKNATWYAFEVAKVTQ